MAAISRRESDLVLIWTVTRHHSLCDRRFVVASIVLPAFLGCDIEDDVLAVVLSGSGFCVLSEAGDEDDSVHYGVWLRLF
jgi:hypothetical protein